MRRVAGAGGRVLRSAGIADLAVVRLLDDAAFSGSSLIRQRAAPGELESGIVAGDVLLLEEAGTPIAYLHVDRGVPGVVEIAGLGVRPERQGLGFGTLLLDHFLATLPPPDATRPAVIALTSPRNVVMLRLVLDRGFAVRRSLRNHYGPGRDRFGCQLLAGPATRDGRSRWIPMSQLRLVHDLVEAGRFLVVGVAGPPAAPSFAVRQRRPDDFATAELPEPRAGLLPAGRPFGGGVGAAKKALVRESFPPPVAPARIALPHRAGRAHGVGSDS